VVEVRMLDGLPNTHLFAASCINDFHGGLLSRNRTSLIEHLDYFTSGCISINRPSCSFPFDNDEGYAVAKDASSSF
jgi:hypothetical protein